MQFKQNLKPIFKIITVFITTAALIACSSYRPPAGTRQQYTVQRGDTISSIAQRFNISKEQLRAQNATKDFSALQTGQILNIPAGSSSFKNPSTRPNSTWNNSQPSPPPSSSYSNQSDSNTLDASDDTKKAEISKLGWTKPTQGRIVRTFNPNIPGHKGIQLAGNSGQKIVAAASGKVEYVGSGNPGYGQVIIIKHANNTYSTYGYLLEIKVRKGQNINAGTEIASMGLSPDKREVLNFEIRYNGKPVNPMLYLN